MKQENEAMRALLNLAIAMITEYGPGGFGYVWGAQGQKITDEELLALEAKYGPNGSGSPGYYHQDRTRKWIGKQAADCSGLIMYLFEVAGIYDQDMTADDIKNRCESVSLGSARPGDLVFRLDGSRAVHVGIRVRGGKTVHCESTAKGLVETTDSEYTHWHTAGRYPDIPPMKPVHAINAVRAHRIY